MEKHKDKGIPFGQSIVDYLQSLIDARNFALALDFVAANRAEIEETGGVNAGKFLRLAAMANLASGNLSVALKTIRVAQIHASKEGDSIALAEVFLVLGNILRDMTHMSEARKAYRDAESIFRRNDALEGQSRALNQLANLYFRQSDYSNALGTLLDAVGIARQLDDKKKLAFMMGNIGRIYTFTGDVAQAEQYLKTNIELSSELADMLEVAKAYLSLGYLYMQQGEHVKAEEALASAYPGIIASNSRRDEVIYKTYLGELHYRMGKNDEALVILHSALAEADQIAPDSTLAGRAMRHIAEMYVRAENFRMAQRFITKAVVIMDRADDKTEKGALLKLKARVAESENRHDEGRKALQESIDLLDQSGVLFEKADALVVAGKSGLFDNRQRLIYLFRAEEFYARARMTLKLEEVGQLISLRETGPVVSSSQRPAPDAKPVTSDLDYLSLNPEIIRFKKQLPMITRPDLPILLTGETGVGKDRMARYYHSMVRPTMPFVAINCASIPETLLESELFGYSKGAFTGADGNKQGLFVAANGGILFLDEIGDMPLSLQAKLLGVLERKKVMPLGSTKEVSLDIIIVAATNQPLETLVEQGRFRRDLYYRLSGIAFHIPPLRERKEDIPLLLQHIMQERGLLKAGESLPTDLVRRFLAYDWPGNIRELQNKIKRLEVMSLLVAEGDLAEVSRSVFEGSIPVTQSDSLFDRVEEFERKLIVEALLAAHGNKSEAARLLGVHEATVRTKLKRYGLETTGGMLN